MSEDDDYWFVPKRYGFGATPDTWQGWALTIGFVAVLVVVARFFAERPVQLTAIVVPLALVFTVICARKTRDGFRWRWGEEE